MFPDSVKTFCFFLKYNLFKRDVVRYYHELLRQQQLSLDEIEHINWQKRKQLLFYASENVPYYRQRFKSIGLNPADIKHPEDYSRIPLLTRADVRQNFEQMISEKANPHALQLATTGGSTGEPLKVMRDKTVPLEAFGWLLRSWWGINPGLNEAVVIRMSGQKKIDLLLNTLLWWPTLRAKLDASSMKAEDIEQFLRKFNTIRPKVIWGYAGAIAHVASCIEEKSFEIFPPKAVWTTSSPLSDSQRKQIETAFNAPVYDQYGCCEVFWLAAQCRQKQGLHMFHTSRLIEFTDDSGHQQPTGTLGNIVITDLENYFFPIIRYVNGDMGRALADKCSCGINLPLMDKIRGRQTDLIKLPNGTCLAGDYLTTIFDDFPDAVKGFRVQQARDYSIKLLYIPSPHAHNLPEVLEKVHRTLLEKTEYQIPITMESVQHIPHDRGKLRYVISELNRG